MSKAEILDELPKLTPAERQEIAIRIQEISGDELTAAEKQILDRELADYEQNPDVGSSWAEVEARIRGSARR
jgi:putative addiction module component (TIGR02574 family)